MINFTSIEYLKGGNSKQKSVYRLIKKHHIFDKLYPFNPILAGTIPINIDIAGSDLDIICYWKDKHTFINCILEDFSHHPEFMIKETTHRGFETVIGRFTLEGYPVELFGQNRPSIKQEAVMHMLIEHQILVNKGNAFKQKVIDLKKRGYKTEPAFAKLLNIKGDPYLGLLNYRIE